MRKLFVPAACAALCACAHVPHLYLAADPLSAAEHYRLGAAYEAQGLPDDAGKQYELAAKLAPGDPDARVALGNVEFMRGDYAAAERDFKRALKISPSHANALNNLAMTYLMERKNLPEAERLAKEALRQDGPLRSYALDTLSNIYRCEGLAPELH
jgi:tetratricopeptide (TPR) repeat protein